VTPPPAAEPPAPGPAGPVAPASPPPLPDELLGRGSTGNDVRLWQQQMARRTWRITVDGVFGRQSASVARRFQREKGLHVDGLVGPATWTAAWRLPVTR
jgi:peptidoglycan hydrolase-like protein with peptidoglycan-binding domain